MSHGAGTENGTADASIADLQAAAASNFRLRACDVAPFDGRASPAARALVRELGCHFRVPHVRFIVRTRVLCQAGRCRAPAGARGASVAWLLERAPLWVVVHVCALLRGSALDGMDLF
jgi:hypothetical protein